ncbi:uncharacterized protein TNCV_4017301 [Trichonephila clavipes]|nr:uncharacterized protein TNCV_4017301 [Trichonephila clavipes]
MGLLIRVDDCLNAQGYLSVIAYQVHPNRLVVHPAGDGYFQQDNTSYHTADIVHKWSEDHNRNLTLFSWLGQSPDINPIENWDEIGRLGGIRQLYSFYYTN